LIAFDMGGTSTDVALYDGALPQRFETSVAGVRLQAPMMNIHTVAAGGGSVLAYDGGRLLVGPQSAGSRPGPACYRNGGPLAVTDVQVLLGRIRPESFPVIFGPRGDEMLDADVVRQRFESLAASMPAAMRAQIEAIAAGFLDVAVESMARAIRHVSVREGHDPADFALLCYGGAAPQHACRVADSLGIGEILIHPLAGVFSAWGIGLADSRLVRRQSLERPLTRETYATLDDAFAGLAEPLVDAMTAHGAAATEVKLHRSLEIRAPGTETALEIPHGPFAGLARQFRAEFARRFGFDAPEDAPQVATLRVEAVVAGGREAASVFAMAPAGAEVAVKAWFDGWREVPLIERESLGEGRRVAGPALIVEAELDDGGRARMVSGAAR
jgi:5-oxoprolinase (ATP-hydrolysing)